MKSIFVFLLPLALAQDCSFSGRDLSPHIEFGTMGPIVDSSSIFSTYLSVCHDGSQTCQLTPEMALRYQTPTFCSSVVGRWVAPEWSMIEPDAEHPNGGVMQSFSNGDLCFGQVSTEPSKTDIHFYCDRDATGDTYTTTSDNFQCDWTFMVNTPHACAGSAGGGSGGGGVGGGWVFVIILLVCSFLYLVVGFLYKTRSKGTSGAESIPNIEFWRQLPGLVKDGCSYTWGLLRGPKYQQMGESGGGGNTSGDYQQQSGF